MSALVSLPHVPLLVEGTQIFQRSCRVFAETLHNMVPRIILTLSLAETPTQNALQNAKGSVDGSPYPVLVCIVARSIYGPATLLFRPRPRVIEAARPAATAEG